MRYQLQERDVEVRMNARSPVHRRRGQGVDGSPERSRAHQAR
ncbi:hypothetical protein [Streptomyces alfalfae]